MVAGDQMYAFDGSTKKKVHPSGYTMIIVQYARCVNRGTVNPLLPLHTPRSSAGGAVLTTHPALRRKGSGTRSPIRATALFPEMKEPGF